MGPKKNRMKRLAKPSGPTFMLTKDELNEIAEKNQLQSTLLKLPAEIRMNIYHSVFQGSEVVVRPEYASNYNRKVHGGDYCGIFALLYTCRQIHREAHELPPTRLTFNLMALGGMGSAPTSVKDGIHKQIRSLVMTAAEAKHYARTIVQNQGSCCNPYWLELFPSLEYVQLVDKTERLTPDSLLEPMKASEALRISFDRPNLRVFLRVKQKPLQLFKQKRGGKSATPEDLPTTLVEL